VHVSAGEFAIILTFVVVGAAAQGSIGFGQNLIVVPVVALVLPEALPGTLVAARSSGSRPGACPAPSSGC
jgi:hypothetical protein